MILVARKPSNGGKKGESETICMLQFKLMALPSAEWNETVFAGGKKLPFNDGHFSL